jgi:hypothetical protein
MIIQKVPVTDIKPAAYNPREDLQPGDPRYEALARSIKEFGFVEPLVWNKRSGNLVGGHQRFKILLASGAKEVECSIVDLDPQTEKALNIALNKVEGDWDQLKLKELLEDIDRSMDVTITGFSHDEFEKLLAMVAEPPMGSLADLTEHGEKDVEQVTFVVHPGQGTQLRERLKEIARRNPDAEDIAPMGWALEQVIENYERLVSG